MVKQEESLLFNGFVQIFFITLGLQVIAMSERSSAVKNTADGVYMVSLRSIIY